MQFKTIQTEFKAGKKEGEYEGYFSIFNNVDDGKDVMLPGCFAKTLSTRKGRIKVLYAHNFEKMVGPPPTELYEDSTGLYAKGRLTLDSFWGRETWALLADGALNEGSFGYLIPRGGAEHKDGIRYINETELLELSFVPLGMNPLTYLEAVKTGARNRRSDLEIINHLHDMAVKLGCTNCKPVRMSESSRALAEYQKTRNKLMETVYEL